MEEETVDLEEKNGENAARLKRREKKWSMAVPMLTTIT